MRIYIDTNGTIVGNVGGHSMQDCLQAAHDLGTVAEVHFMSGDPVSASEQLGGAVVLEKLDIITDRGLMTRAIVVDDDQTILRSAVLYGAATVPAAMLLELADAMVPERAEAKAYEARLARQFDQLAALRAGRLT